MTYVEAPGSAARGPLVRFATAIEGASALDAAAGKIRSLANALTADPARRDLLQGKWLGHALHPLMTDLPIGFWTSAGVLDLAGGQASQRAAELLTGLGVATAVPTVVTGWAEFAGLGTDRDRRTATVHALGNSIATACYAGSWMARRRGRRATGVALGLSGATAASFAGFLGGHLVAARRVATRHPAFEDG